jgi:hypothetical protein
MLHEDPHWHDKPELEQAALKDFLDSWQSWLDGLHAIPLRQSFDPIDFPRLLPWLILFEVLPVNSSGGDPAPQGSSLAEGPAIDLGIRYIGSEIEHYFDSRNVTGRKMSEFGPTFLRRWTEVGAKVIAGRGPRFFHGAPFQVKKSFVAMEMLALPLSKKGRAVDFLLLALAVQPKKKGGF